MVLITPVCSLPSEVAHATLHGLGLEHARHESFNEINAKAALFSYQCPDIQIKLQSFEGIRRS